MSANDNYKIEDFWPGAEELLDQHFNKKPGGAKPIVYLGAALLVCSAVAYYFLSGDSNVSQSKPLTHSSQIENTHSNSTSSNTTIPVSESNTTEKKLEPNSNSESPSANNIQSNSLTDQYIPSQTESNTSLKTNTNKKIASSTTANSNVQKSNPTAINQSERPVNTKKEVNKSTVNSGNPTINSNQLTSESNAVAQVSVALKTEKEIAPTANKTSLNQTKNNVEVEGNSVANNTNNSVTELTASTSLYKPQASSENALPQAESANLFAQSVEVLAGIKIPLVQQELNEQTIAPLNSEEELTKYPVKAKKFAFSYLAGFGLYSVNKHLSATNMDAYINRRNAEESQTMFASYQLGVQVQMKRWGLSSGLEYSSYGEEIQYDSWLNGFQNSVQTNTNYQTDSSYNTHFYYVRGNEFTFTSLVEQTDTLITYDTTQIAGKITADVSKVNSRTQFSYVEIPLVLHYDLIQKRKFSAGIQTGISLGILQQKRGYYLDAQLSEFTNLKDSKEFNQLVWNARVGLDIQYYFHPATSVFLRPEFRTNLQSIFTPATGINQRYQSFGLTIGISKSF